MRVVYAPPIPVPEIDYENYDIDKILAAQAEHQEAVKAWLKANGYPGKRTGEIVTFPVADGQARYMLAEGRRSVLVHLPYGDAWEYRDIEHLPKAEILRRIDARKNLAALFSEARP